MAIKTVLESLDGVDDALHPLYAETDGKFILQVDGVDAHPDVANLKSAYERVKADKAALATERDALKQRAASIPEDFDPKVWEKAKDGKPDEGKLIELRAELEGKIASLTTDLEAERGKSLRNALDRDLTDALNAAGVTNPAFAKAARTMIAPDVKVGEDGKPMIETDMGPLALVEHVKRWAAGEGKDFVTPASGGGSKGGTGSTGKKFAEMSPAELVNLHRENPAEYARLKAQG